MTTRPDDLKVGQYIALVRDKDDGEVEYNPFWFGQRRYTEKIDGRPLEILAISLPFLSVSDGKRRFGIDLRQFDVQVLTRHYAESLWPQDTDSVKKFRGRRKVVREKPDPDACPRCGEKMVQVLSFTTGWTRVCRGCHFNGGPVEIKGPFP